MKLSIVAAIATLSVTVLAQRTAPCGCGIPPCPPRDVCVPVHEECPDTSFCPGVCQQVTGEVNGFFIEDHYQSCFPWDAESARKCPRGTTCMIDPRRPDCQRSGICVPEKYEYCGGFAGFMCSNPEHQCYDIPGDGCDPPTGADCMGICLYPIPNPTP